MVEDSVRIWALQDEAIKAEIGERFYCDKVPDGVGDIYPFVKYSQIDDDQKQSYSGSVGHIPFFQIDVYSDSKSGCNDLSELLFSRFDGHSGVMGDVTVGYTLIRNIRGKWSPDGRHFRRILELRIGTNER